MRNINVLWGDHNCPSAHFISQTIQGISVRVLEVYTKNCHINLTLVCTGHV